MERKFECPLFDEFLEGDFFHFKIRILLQIKIHELNKAMVKKYFHKLNILLNKYLQWNKSSQEWVVLKLVVHSLVQHVFSIGTYRPIRPKHTPHVAPIYESISLKSWIAFTYWPLTCLRMDKSGMFHYENN